METMDILENRIKETLSIKTKLEAEHKNLSEEILKLRESVEKLEKEKDGIKHKLDGVIEKVQIYLSRSEA
jgi:predicted  nucleic acid-binding Zn-ribbon protein